ncbi:SemiSWEET transporter [Geobacter sp.]|uniref:SemiSWEET family sugar transporter n=1 Tax=Geobacter sp. TaxID=46610 RepID=UPI00260AEFC7|nr:SemiSWEET transporter [Geobacter sp.]
MNSATLLGLVAGAITSIATVPQVVKAYRSRQVRDISIWQPVLLVAGMVLWLAYGVLLGDIPLIAANIFSIACNGILIVMKFCYREADKIPADDYALENIQKTEEL